MRTLNNTYKILKIQILNGIKNKRVQYTHS